MQASPELHTIIAEWFNSWESGSTGKHFWADHHLTRKAELHTIGTDPSEWLEGKKAFSHMKQEMNDAEDIQFSPGEIKAWQEETVGWGIACPTFVSPSGKRISIRWSAVFHQEDAEWKMVQLHMSVGVPNDQLLG